MHMSRTVSLALAASSGLALLAGCSGGSQAGAPTLPTTPQAQSAERAPALDVAGSTGMTYVAPIGSTIVYGYQRANQGNHAPLCTITGFTTVNGGIGVDQSGNLWVPDEGASPRAITEFGPNCGAKKTVLTDPGDVGPNNVAFDTTGHVYVSNSFANSGGPGNILQYTGTKITKTLTDPDIATPQGLAIDKSNNVWVSYRDPGSSGTYVAEYPGGTMPAKLFKNISLGFPGSLQFDHKGNLLAIDGDTSAMNVYAPPYTETKPTHQLILEFGSINSPSMCTLGHNQKALYCTFGFFSVMGVFSYPAGKFQYTYDSGMTGLLPYGIANDPAPLN
jgi:sugar lactone lactonase YvrE